jgi:radical SAM protein with 4Fe4S-binding SPASM domain
MINYSKLFDASRNMYANLSYFSNSGKAIMPVRYFFELTHRCNLQCPYCYIGSREKEELTMQEWFKIIDQIPFYSFVTLVGGEPFLRKDFIPILQKTVKKTFGKVNVVTNGILMNEEIIDSLIAAKIMLLCVSLDGWGKNHDMNRGQAGIFDKVISNLEKLNYKRNKNKNRPMVDIKTIVLKNNLDDLLKLYKLCSDMKFDFFSISFLRDNGQSISDNFCLEELNKNRNNDAVPYFDLKHFEQVFKELEEMSKKSITKIRFAPKFEGKMALEKIKRFFQEDSKKNVNDFCSPCKIPWSDMAINPCGDIYPCLSFRIKVDNIKNKKLIDVYNNETLRDFRKKLKCSKVFPSCQMCCELMIKN